MHRGNSCQSSMGAKYQFANYTWVEDPINSCKMQEVVNVLENYTILVAISQYSVTLLYFSADSHTIEHKTHVSHQESIMSKKKNGRGRSGKHPHK